MKLRKLPLAILSIFFIVAFVVSCNNDDDESNVIPDRDRTEVYNEDIAEIEMFLQTHFYNYEEFDSGNPYSEANDTFQIVFDTIAGDNSDKTPLIDQVDFKIVTDQGVDYKLYYLQVREGLGNEISFIDEANLIYEGSKLDGYVFDSAVNPSKFNLTTVGQASGVVTGFREGILEFKTSTGFTDNGDGTETYHNHGIGAVFIPSGLGYFSQPLIGVPSYTPLVFKFSLYTRTVLDHDADNIPSIMENLDGDDDVYDDDTDGDFGANFIDNDDDNDGVFTKDELDYNEYIVDTNQGETEPVLASNEYEMDREEVNGVITIKTFVLTDTDGDGTPDYLDSSTN